MPEPVEGDVEPGDRDRSLKGFPGTLGRPQAPDSTFRWLQADQQVVDDPTHRHLASATVPTWFGSYTVTQGWMAATGAGSAHERPHHQIAFALAGSARDRRLPTREAIICRSSSDSAPNQHGTRYAINPAPTVPRKVTRVVGATTLSIA
jgi:hypothetical protein